MIVSPSFKNAILKCFAEKTVDKISIIQKEENTPEKSYEAPRMVVLNNAYIVDEKTLEQAAFNELRDAIVSVKNNMDAT